MRIASKIEMEKFKLFCKELSKLNEIGALSEINSKTPHTLQIISFHLVFEYTIEKWIDFKANNGNQLFIGIEKIGFHNKLYIAKNIGLPKTIFKVLDTINNERNKFAHQISKKIIPEDEIFKIGKMADEIEIMGAKFSELGIVEKGRTIYASNTKCEMELLYIALHTIFGKLRNFVFIDIQSTYSKNTFQMPFEKI
ncbi:hypothetical protein [Janthinobacterium lividum]